MEEILFTSRQCQEIEAENQQTGRTFYFGHLGQEKEGLPANPLPLKLTGRH